MILAHLIGFLGKDPEKKITPNGFTGYEISIACTIRKNKTIWWRVMFWGSHWERTMEHFKKGKPAFIIAELASALETFRDRNGEIKVGYQAEGKSIHFVSLGVPEQKREEVAQDTEVRVGQATDNYQDQEDMPF